MSSDIFLKIDGVSGESKDKEFAGAIDVLSWSWGMSQPSSASVGGGAGAGKASFQDLTIVKHVDQSSSTLMKFLCTGKALGKVQLVARKATGDKPLKFVTIDLAGGIVTDLHPGGGAGDAQFVETLHLSFKEFKFTYTPQTEKGTGGAAQECAWNVASNSDSLSSIK